MRRISTLVCIAMLAPALAYAGPTTSDDWYKEGDTQYNLGNFDKAVDAFKKGFEIETNDSKKPAYLYNIAQAYRQAGNCKDSLFFYKRFLSLKATDTVKPLKPELKADIEKRMAELDTCVTQQTALKNKPPDSTDGGDKTGGDKTGGDKTGGDKTGGDKTGGDKTGSGDKRNKTVGSADDGSGDDDEGGVTKRATPIAQPTVIVARLVGGAAKVSAGDLTVPVRFTGALIGGYPLAINEQLTLELGAALAFQPAPYEDESGKSQSASFFSVLANVGASYQAAPKIGIRADVGVGVLTFSGLQMGNPFTEGGAGTTGALTMLAVRVGLSADYAFTPNVFGTLAPIAFSYSPAKSGFETGISSITRLDFMVGVGYRM